MKVTTEAPVNTRLPYSFRLSIGAGVRSSHRMKPTPVTTATAKSSRMVSDIQPRR